MAIKLNTKTAQSATKPFSKGIQKVEVKPVDVAALTKAFVAYVKSDAVSIEWLEKNRFTGFHATTSDRAHVNTYMVIEAVCKSLPLITDEDVFWKSFTKNIDWSKCKNIQKVATELGL